MKLASAVGAYKNLYTKAVAANFSKEQIVKEVSSAGMSEAQARVLIPTRLSSTGRSIGQVSKIADAVTSRMPEVRLGV